MSEVNPDILAAFGQALGADGTETPEPAADATGVAEDSTEAAQAATTAVETPGTPAAETPAEPVVPVEQAPETTVAKTPTDAAEPVVDNSELPKEPVTTLDVEQFPAELRPYALKLREDAKSQQADYTRKTQEVASVSKVVQENAQVINAILGTEAPFGATADEVIAKGLEKLVKIHTDRDSALQFHKELGEALGVTPEAAAPVEVEATAPATDPVVAQLQANYQRLEQQLKAQTAAQIQAQQQAQQQAAMQAQAQQLATEFKAISDSPEFKSLGENGLNMVRQLWVANGGSLLDHAKQVKGLLDVQQNAYVESKQTQADTGVTAPGAATATVPVPAQAPKSLKEASKLALGAFTAAAQS